VQYELRYQVIEPKRHTYQNLIERYGDESASRYLEGSIDIEPKENFHYRPTWARDRELYDARYSALRLADPYVFTDPRQYYYTPYVTARAAHHEAFGKTLDYLEKRDLLAKMPPGWQAVVASAVLPLRHFESGAQLVTINGARFGHGTTITQCCTYAAFDRIGNAQQLSRVGIALASGSGDLLGAAKREWLEGDHLQPLRELAENIMVSSDWAAGVLAVDTVDALVYPLLYTGLDEAALLGGGGAYSLVAQHLASWYLDQRKWLDALVAAWLADAEHGPANRAELGRLSQKWAPQATAAVMALAEFIDREIPAAGACDTVRATADAVASRWTTKLEEPA